MYMCKICSCCMAWQSSILLDNRQGNTGWEWNSCVQWRQSIHIRHRLRALSVNMEWKGEGNTDTKEPWFILVSNHSSKHFGYINIKRAYRVHNKNELLNQPHMVCPANSHLGSSTICSSSFLWTPPLAKCAWTQALTVREEWCSPDRGYRR